MSDTNKDLPSIPMPVADLRSLVMCCTALKQAVEVLAQRRGANQTDPNQFPAGTQ